MRVLAATHQNLTDAVSRRTFRTDLLARLAEFEIDLPDLAQRRVDVLPIFTQLAGLPVSADAAEALLLQPWTTNVRGLQALARRIGLLLKGVQQIELSMLPTDVQSTVEVRPVAPPTEVDQAKLEGLLSTHGGNVSRVARALDMTRQQVYRRLQTLGINARHYR